MREKFLHTFSLYLLVFLGILIYGCTPPQADPDFVPPINSQNGQNNPAKPLDSDNLKVLTVEPDQEFILSLGQQANLKDENVSVYFLDIVSDSRCPSDARCITSGTVAISVKNPLEEGSEEAAIRNLNLGQTIHFTSDYDLEFIKIEPERGKQSEEISKMDYRVTLKFKSTVLNKW